MSKNAEGWVRHRGGKCPVEAGTVIECRERNGNIEVECKPQLLGDMWFHENKPHDIMAYRLHKPAEQVEQVEAEQVMRVCVEKCASTESAGELLYDPIAQGPLQWRDRITELDEERKTIDALYQVNTARIETERAELVQKLAGEGFALIGRVVEPVEDMSDWRNWKAGDLVECISDPGSKGINVGRIYRLTFVSDDSFGFLDDDGDHRDRGDMNRFKFHSRPSA